MKHIYEAMKVFKDDDYIVFVINGRFKAEINLNMRLLQAEEMAIVSWSVFSNYPVEGHLTRKGINLRDYLKSYEWN